MSHTDEHSIDTQKLASDRAGQWACPDDWLRILIAITCLIVIKGLLFHIKGDSEKSQKLIFCIYLYLLKEAHFFKGIICRNQSLVDEN